MYQYKLGISVLDIEFQKMIKVVSKPHIEKTFEFIKNAFVKLLTANISTILFD